MTTPKITYDSKDYTLPTSDPRRKWRDVDANEVKGVVNDLSDKVDEKADTAYVDSALDGLKWKEPARAATTANISLTGLQTIDGVELEAGDRVLVKDQTDKTQNGIYTADSSTWPRASDATTGALLQSATLVVNEGLDNDNFTFTQIADSPLIGTDDIVFADKGSGIIPYNGARVIKRAPFTGINPGGTNVVEFLDNLFYPTVDATISANLNLLEYRERGLPEINTPGPGGTNILSAVVTANDGTSIKTRLYDASLNAPVGSYVAWPGFLPYYGLPVEVNVDKNWKVQMEFQSGGVTKTVLTPNTKVVKYIQPYYIGFFDSYPPEPFTSAGLQSAGLTKVIDVLGSQLIKRLNGSGKQIVFAYPASKGLLTSIIDPNNFNVTAAFQSILINLTSASPAWASTSYRLYFTTLPTTVNNADFKFNF